MIGCHLFVGKSLFFFQGVLECDQRCGGKALSGIAYPRGGGFTCPGTVSLFCRNIHFMRNSHLQVLELGGQLSVLLGNPVANLEELLTWSEAELLRVTSGDTGMQHTRAQVCSVLGNHWSLILVSYDYHQTMKQFI